MRINLQLNDEFVRGTDFHALKEAIKEALRNNISPYIIAGPHGEHAVPDIRVNIDDDIIGVVHQIDMLLNARAISLDFDKSLCYAFGNEPDAFHSRYGIYYFCAKPELKCYPGSIVKIPVTNYNNDDSGICVVKNPVLKKEFKPKKSISEVIDTKQLPYEIPQEARTLFCLLYSAIMKNEVYMSDIDKFLTEVIRKNNVVLGSLG